MPEKRAMRLSPPSQAPPTTPSGVSSLSIPASLHVWFMRAYSAHVVARLIEAGDIALALFRHHRVDLLDEDVHVSAFLPCLRDVDELTGRLSVHIKRMFQDPNIPPCAQIREH